MRHYNLPHITPDECISFRSEYSISEFDFIIIYEEIEVFSFNCGICGNEPYKEADSERSKRQDGLYTINSENRTNQRNIQSSNEKSSKKYPDQYFTAFCKLLLR